MVENLTVLSIFYRVPPLLFCYHEKHFLMIKHNVDFFFFRGSRPEVFCKYIFKKTALFLQENSKVRVSFLIKLIVWLVTFNLGFTSYSFRCGHLQMMFKEAALKMENTCDGGLFPWSWQLWLYNEKIPYQRFFPVNFDKFSIFYRIPKCEWFCFFQPSYQYFESTSPKALRQLPCRSNNGLAH